ncbi:MAG: hypothetical protein ACOYB7_15085 [Mycobacterium sp.]
MSAAAASGGTVGVLPPRASDKEVKKLPTTLTASAGWGETSWTVPVTVWPAAAMPEVIAVAVVGVSNTRIGESGTSGAGMEKSVGDIVTAG